MWQFSCNFIGLNSSICTNFAIVGLFDAFFYCFGLSIDTGHFCVYILVFCVLYCTVIVIHLANMLLVVTFLSCVLAHAFIYFLI